MLLRCNNWGCSCRGLTRSMPVDVDLRDRLGNGNPLGHCGGRSGHCVTVAGNIIFFRTQGCICSISVKPNFKIIYLEELRIITWNKSQENRTFISWKCDSPCRWSMQLTGTWLPLHYKTLAPSSEAWTRTSLLLACLLAATQWLNVDDAAGDDHAQSRHSRRIKRRPTCYYRFCDRRTLPPTSSH